MLHAEGDEDGIGRRLHFCQYHRPAGLQHHHHGFVAHGLLGLGHHRQVVVVARLHGLALITAVGRLLQRVASADARLTCFCGGVVVVLQAHGDISVAAAAYVVSVVAHADGRLGYQTEGEVSLLGLVGHVVVFLYQVERDGVVGLLFRHAAPDAGNGGEMTFGHIHLEAFADGERGIAVVLHHHHRLELGLIAFLHKLRLSYRLFCALRVEIGVLEESHP